MGAAPQVRQVRGSSTNTLFFCFCQKGVVRASISISLSRLYQSQNNFGGIQKSKYVTSLVATVFRFEARRRTGFLMTCICLLSPKVSLLWSKIRSTYQDLFFCTYFATFFDIQTAFRLSWRKMVQNDKWIRPKLILKGEWCTSHNWTLICLSFCSQPKQKSGIISEICGRNKIDYSQYIDTKNCTANVYVLVW